MRKKPWKTVYRTGVGCSFPWAYLMFLHIKCKKNKYNLRDMRCKMFSTFLTVFYCFVCVLLYEKNRVPWFFDFRKKSWSEKQEKSYVLLKKKKRVPYRGVCGYIILNSANSAVWYYSSKLLKPVQCRLCARAIGAHVIFVQRYFFLFVEFYGGAGFARCSTFSRRHGTWFVDFCVFMKTILRKHVFFFYPFANYSFEFSCTKIEGATFFFSLSKKYSKLCKN